MSNRKKLMKKPVEMNSNFTVKEKRVKMTLSQMNRQQRRAYLKNIREGK